MDTKVETTREYLITALENAIDSPDIFNYSLFMWNVDIAEKIDSAIFSDFLELLIANNFIRKANTWSQNDYIVGSHKSVEAITHSQYYIPTLMKNSIDEFTFYLNRFINERSTYSDDNHAINKYRCAVYEGQDGVFYEYGNAEKGYIVHRIPKTEMLPLNLEERAILASILASTTLGVHEWVVYNKEGILIQSEVPREALANRHIFVDEIGQTKSFQTDTGIVLNDSFTRITGRFIE